MSLDSFVPDEQAAKLKLIKQAPKSSILRSIRFGRRRRRRTAENVAALKDSAGSLRKLAGDRKGPGAETANVAPTTCPRWPNQSTGARQVGRPLSWCRCRLRWDQLRNAMQAQPVSLETLSARTGR